MRKQKIHILVTNVYPCNDYTCGPIGTLKYVMSHYRNYAHPLYLKITFLYLYSITIQLLKCTLYISSYLLFVYLLHLLHAYATT